MRRSKKPTTELFIKYGSLQVEVQENFDKTFTLLLSDYERDEPYRFTITREELQSLAIHLKGVAE